MTSEYGDTPQARQAAPATALSNGHPAPPTGASLDGAVSIAPVRVAIDWRFPSDGRYIEPVVEVVRQQCEQCAFPPRKCSLNVPVALTEALSNAILRGNREDLTKDVRLHVEVDQHAMVLEIVDQGSGFDLDSCTRDPREPGNLSEENGRGLYLMRRLMDSVERYSDGGNVVRLTLRR
jgi:serine/threonine-protein kinase RsbW